jgi:hypothetical protein
MPHGPILALAALLAVGAAPAPADVQVHRENGYVAFDYSWPAAVAAEPGLARALRLRMAGELRQATINARAQSAAARRGGYEFARHLFETSWRFEGRGARLTSLSAETSSFTGGGHAEPGYEVFLWDRSATRALDIHRLFGRAALAALNPRFCAARLAALSEHLSEPPGDPREEGEWACPLLIEQTMGPADADGDGRFDTLRIFVSRGYFDTEGYTVDVALTAGDLVRIPALYRSGFEPR